MIAVSRVVRVGVTGHRVFDDPGAAGERVRAALRRILVLAGDERLATPVRLEVLSALAEGADRLAVREALTLPGTALVAVLPFPVDDYARDFATEASRREFAELLARARAVEVMPPAPTREAGYESQGRWVTDHSDVLLVVWDGGPARGQGGTAEIVAYAADRGTPILWVRVTRAQARQ